MNEIINKFLLAGDKFMCEMHLRHPEFTYSASCKFNPILVGGGQHCPPT